MPTMEMEAQRDGESALLGSKRRAKHFGHRWGLDFRFSRFKFQGFRCGVLVVGFRFGVSSFRF